MEATSAHAASSSSSTAMNLNDALAEAAHDSKSPKSDASSDKDSKTDDDSAPADKPAVLPIAPFRAVIIRQYPIVHRDKGIPHAATPSAKSTPSPSKSTTSAPPPSSTAPSSSIAPLKRLNQRAYNRLVDALQRALEDKLERDAYRTRSPTLSSSSSSKSSSREENGSYERDPALQKEIDKFQGDLQERFSPSFVKMMEIMSTSPTTYTLGAVSEMTRRIRSHRINVLLSSFTNLYRVRHRR